MKLKLFIPIIIICCLFTAITITFLKTEKLPSMMLFNGQAIDPQAIDIASNGEFNLDETENLKKNITIINTNKGFQCDKCIGYKYKFKNDINNSEDNNYSAYSYYKYLGQLDDNTCLLLRFQWGGGTGVFSEILILKREKNIISPIESLIYGDRSYGVIDATYKNKIVYFSRYLNAETLLTEITKVVNFDCEKGLSLGQLHYNSPLAAGEYMIDLNSKNRNIELLGINLDFKSFGYPPDHPVGIVLNDLIIQNKQNGISYINKTDFKDFAINFIKSYAKKYNINCTIR